VEIVDVQIVVYMVELGWRRVQLRALKYSWICWGYFWREVCSYSSSK